MTAAHVHLGKPGATGPAAVRLCAPCISDAVGTAKLTPAGAAALRQRLAYVDVHTAQASLRGQVATGFVPSLQLALTDGQSLNLPASVRYSVAGLRVANDAGRIAMLTPGATQPRELDFGADGVVYLPNDPLLTGKRDLTFVLVGANGVTLRNPEARVTVYGLLLSGRR